MRRKGRHADGRHRPVTRHRGDEGVRGGRLECNVDPASAVRLRRRGAADRVSAKMQRRCVSPVSDGQDAACGGPRKAGLVTAGKGDVVQIQGIALREFRDRRREK